MNRSSGEIWFKVPDVGGISDWGEGGGVLRGAVTAALTNSSRRNLGQNIHPQAPGTEGNLTKIITQEIQNVQKLAAAAQVEIGFLKPQQLKVARM